MLFNFLGKYANCYWNAIFANSAQLNHLFIEIMEHLFLIYLSSENYPLAVQTIINGNIWKLAK